MKRKPLPPTHSNTVYRNWLYKPIVRVFIYTSVPVLIIVCVIFYVILENGSFNYYPTQVVLPTVAPSQTHTLAVIPTQKPSFIALATATLQNITSPLVFDFSACAEKCNGNNSTKNFPEAMTRIYVQWSFDNIPQGAEYVRSWTMDGEEWIRYECSWSGNESGRDSITLTEPEGLHSGTWELIIRVGGNILLKEQIYISGNWDYWDPAGTLYSCYGKTD